MFGKIFSIVAGVMLINSFYMPWYKLPGISQTSPLDIVNYNLSLPFTTQTVLNILVMVSILILGGLLILTVIFSKIILSIIKLALAIFLLIFQTGYFYEKVIAGSNPFDLIHIFDSSFGFIVFMVALILYFITVIFAIILSPVKGLGKIIGF